VGVGSVTGVTTEVTSDTGMGNTCTSNCNDNYELQINTNFFSRNLATGACSGSVGTCDSSPNKQSTTTPCQCWQQFLFANPGDDNFVSSEVYMEYWLVDYGSAACPAGWTSSTSIDSQNQVHFDCLKDSVASSVPRDNLSITNLANLTLTGSVVPGGLDSVILSTGNSTVGTLTARAADSQFNLSQAWNNAEFNVVGDADLTVANFNNGSSIVVQTSVTNGTSASPTCTGPVDGGTTGETNNFTLVPGSCCATGGSSPAIRFTESNAGVSAPFCLLNDIVPIQAPLL